MTATVLVVDDLEQNISRSYCQILCRPISNIAALIPISILYAQ